MQNDRVLLVALAPPTVDALLLDIETRTAYEAAWINAMVRISYRPPASPLEDQALTPPMEISAFLLREDETSVPVVLAPARRLTGVTEVKVHFANREPLTGVIERPTDGRDAPLVRVRLQELPVSTLALRWAPSDRVVLGRRAWVIERPRGRGPLGELLDPVLVNTSIGPAVEPPLERFMSARLRAVDGLPLLDVDGTVLCAVFRPSPVDPTVAYCTPREWAFEVPKKASDE